MTDMIERVARAVKDCEVFPLGDMLEYLSPKDAITIARAAVKAMRDITLPDDVRYKGYKSGRVMYEAIIDAVLEEK